MAWQTDILTPLIIITGDGKQYTVAWRPTGRVEEYNVSSFEFNNLAGTYVDRGYRKGRKFPFTFIFQGDDYIKQVDEFLKSAASLNPWTVRHPLYGTITCKVAALSMDDSQLNVSEISCTLLETLPSDGTVFVDSPVDKIASDKAVLDGNFVTAFSATPAVKDITTLTNTNKQLYTKGVKLGGTSDYFNTFKAANAGVLTVISKPAQAMRLTQALINQPAQFENGVKDRLQVLGAQFTTLRKTTLPGSSKAAKKIYELQGGTLISAHALAASTPATGDYQSTNDVLAVVSQLTANYNAYVSDLDALQTPTGDLPTSYIPDPTSLIGLNELINYTISQLMAIALAAKQERSIILEKDSNWILLAHRFYGISPDDTELVLLMNQNNAGLDEILGVKKGRKITYYV